jgi:lysophospholipase L1-like esterase
MITMGKTVNYVAFGDSLTVGFGAAPGQGFVHLFHQAAEHALGIRIQTTHAGTNGATTSRLLEILESDIALRTALKHAEILTITAGGNDLIQAAMPFFFENKPDYLKSALQQYDANYRKLLSEIKAIQEEAAEENRRECLILLVGLYNPLPQIPDAAYWVQRFNLFLRRLEGSNVRAVSVYDAFVDTDDQLLYEDHIHPNDEGYKRIAEQVQKAARFNELERQWL